jgi:membrane associated rhomboid family serine protease
MDDGKQGYDPSPMNPLPPIVLVLFLVIFLMEAAFAGAEAGLFGGAQAVGWRIGVIQDYGFSPRVLDWMVETGRWPIEHLMRFVTYPFLHLGFVHMIFAGAILLAMGKMVGEVIGAVAVAVIFFGSSIAGAAVYGLAFSEQAWLVGAYPAAYGLIGGFTFILWTRARMTGGNQAQAFTLIAFLMGIQLLFGLLFGTDNTWVAEFVGFCAGFLLCFVLVPGARAALLAKLRQER